MTLSMLNLMQILEKVGLPELFIHIEEKMEKVVLPSYIDQVSHVALKSAKKGVPLTKEFCSNTDKALKSFFASITVTTVQNVSFDDHWFLVTTTVYNLIYTHIIQYCMKLFFL